MKKKMLVKVVLSAVLCAVFSVMLILSCPASALRGGSERDPFVPLVGVTAERTHGGILTIMSISDVSFQGIASDPSGKSSLILNGEIIAEGETVGLVTVESVGSNTAVITIDGELHTLTLYDI